MERHRVTAGAEPIGWVAYETASDIWVPTVWPTKESIARGAWRDCLRPPDVDGTPHRLRIVNVDDHGTSMGPFLYCPTCACLVPPPHDGYAYGDYPIEWMTLVDGAVP